MNHEKLLATFVYEAENGTLRKVLNCRKPYPWRNTGKDGRYLAGCFAGKGYYLHQLVWAYHFGFVPAMLDHINGDTKDNRVENLRPCTNAQNQYNSVRKNINKAGFKGVVFHKACRGRPWQAKIATKGRVISLGYYATPQDAAIAYARGAEKIALAFARHDEQEALRDARI